MALLLGLLLSASDFEAAELEAVQLPPDEGIARMEAWRAAHPDSPDHARALLWEAQRRLTQERFVDARRLLELARAAHPDAELDLDLALSLADVLALEHRYGDAAAAYAALRAPPGSRWAMQAALRGEAMRAAAERRTVMFVLGALSLIIFVARLAQARVRRALWPPPEEVTWAGPVLLLFALAGASRPPDERTAVVLVALGGLGLLWLTGAALRTRVLGPGARLVELVLATFLAASLLYCAITVAELWPRVLDTIAGGAE
jgi:hypothetical protein